MRHLIHRDQGVWPEADDAGRQVDELLKPRRPQPFLHVEALDGGTVPLMQPGREEDRLTPVHRQAYKALGHGDDGFGAVDDGTLRKPHVMMIHLNIVGAISTS